MPAAEASLVRELAGRMRTPRLRTLSEFAEAEIVVPTGRYAGRRFRLDRHPAARLLFAELPKWRRAFITGPNQDGKSFCGFVIPTMYLLFERRETVVLGVPTLDMVADKWTVDLLPVIKSSKYHRLLPQRGKGSKQGDSVLFSFANGAHLRFMTAGGDDQSRAAFTTPNLVVTETDGFDETGGNSREGDKFRQLERRTLAFGNDARVWAECTVSTEQGRTWQEIQNGTASRIALPCPHCKAWVTPEREHLVGWQNADSEAEAVALAQLTCPGCGELWTNAQRIEANRRAVLVHKGQEVASDGTVTGETNAVTLGFRWTAVNSVLVPERLPGVGGLEWKAKRAADEETAEKDLRQSQWALPAEADKLDLSQLDAFAVMRRTLARYARGALPEGTEFITVGCDIGKWLCHWVAVAWRKNATPHVIDYDRIECPARDMSEEDAILTGLRSWRDEVIKPGWGERKPVLKLVDARYKTDTIFGFTAESGEDYVATMGFGATQKRQGGYKRESGSKVVGLGENYALVQTKPGRRYLEVNSDEWKSWLHARVTTPTDHPSALTLFEPTEGVDHLSFAKHLTSEKRVEKFVPDQGTVLMWEAKSRNNHWLDALMLACVAAHAVGARLAEPVAAPSPAPDTRQADQRMTDPHGRPFLVTRRD